MPDYDDTNRGAIFKNKKKETENHPDMTGTLNVDGTEYWVSGWSKTSKAGDRFLSLSVKPKDGKAAPKRDSGKMEDLEDDTLPF